MSPKVPRDLSGREIVAMMRREFGYEVKSQVGSHITLHRPERSEAHITVPDHSSVQVGTLGNILRALGKQTGLTKDEILRLL